MTLRLTTQRQSDGSRGTSGAVRNLQRAKPGDRLSIQLLSKWIVERNEVICQEWPSAAAPTRTQQHSKLFHSRLWSHEALRSRGQGSHAQTESLDSRCRSSQNVALILQSGEDKPFKLETFRGRRAARLQKQTKKKVKKHTEVRNLSRETDAAPPSVFPTDTDREQRADVDENETT